MFKPLNVKATSNVIQASVDSSSIQMIKATRQQHIYLFFAFCIHSLSNQHIWHYNVVFQSACCSFFFQLSSRKIEDIEDTSNFRESDLFYGTGKWKTPIQQKHRGPEEEKPGATCLWSVIFDLTEGSNPSGILNM